MAQKLKNRMNYFDSYIYKSMVYKYYRLEEVQNYLNKYSEYSIY